MTKFVLYSSKENKETKKKHVFIKSLSTLIDGKSRELRMCRTQQTRFLSEYIAQGNQYHTKGNFN